MQFYPLHVSGANPMFHVCFDGRLELIEDSPTGLVVEVQNVDLACGVRSVLAEVLAKAGKTGPIICKDGHSVIRGILEVIVCQD